VEEEDVRSFLAALTREAEWVDVEIQIQACRDPKDDKFLELAASGMGTHIVTGDTDSSSAESLPGHRDSSSSFVLRKVENRKEKRDFSHSQADAFAGAKKSRPAFVRNAGWWRLGMLRGEARPSLFSISLALYFDPVYPAC
jgi:hypothetical protein